VSPVPVLKQPLSGRAASRPRCGRDTPDDVLVCRARRGCLSAYAELNDRHGPLAYRVALRLLGDRDDAEDLTREALVAAWQNLSAFRRGSSYAAWLLQILIRRAPSRTSPIRLTESSSKPGNVISGGPPPALEAEAAAAVVAALPLPQRAVIVLHHFENMSYDQVALITSSTVPTVRRHLFQVERRAKGGVVADEDGQVAARPDNPDREKHAALRGARRARAVPCGDRRPGSPAKRSRHRRRRAVR
jgi:RNA polymerase sigma-70 factor (ECF subfamily)